MKKIFIFIKGHKLVSIVVLCLIISGSYFSYQKINQNQETIQYITQTAKTGELVSSISGTGQIFALDEVEIKPKVSGDIVFINVKNGQTIKKGDLITQIDSREAVRNVNEAKSSLENVKLDLEELLGPVDSYTLLQAENSLADTQDSLIKLKTAQENNYQASLDAKTKAENDLKNEHENAYNGIVSAFLDLPNITTGLYTILFSYEISNSEATVSLSSNNTALRNMFLSTDYVEKDKFGKYVENLEDEYNETKIVYNKNFDIYKNISRYSEKSVIEDTLEQTIETIKKIADTIKNTSNTIDYWVDYRTDNELRIYSKVINYQSNLSSYAPQTNSHLLSLLSIQSSIQDYKENILDAERDLKEMDQNNPLNLAAIERSIKEKQEKLLDLKSYPDELEIKNKELSIQQKQNSLIEAQQNLNDHYIYAPLNGIVSNMDISLGDSVSSSTIISSLVSNKNIVEITLNEIDIAQVKLEQKVKIDFDAIEDLIISGEIAEVDASGEVSQGVVSYGIKIIFDNQDERIKPGMSVNAEIIIESKENIIIIPLSAVKTVKNISYVQVFVNNVSQKQSVELGISNDIMVEVIKGIKQGDEIITQTVTETGETISSENKNSNNTNNRPPEMQIMKMMR